MLKLVSVVSAALLFSLPCAAQVASAEMSGIVLYSSGGVVPGAKVTATNLATASYKFLCS